MKTQEEIEAAVCDLLKQVPTQRVGTAWSVLEAVVQKAAGVKVLSLHHDIHLTTGGHIP